MILALAPVLHPALRTALTASVIALPVPVTQGPRHRWSAHAQPAPISAITGRSACAVPGAARRADATLRASVRRYRDESSGSTIHADLRIIAGDRRLRHALSVFDFPAAQAEANRQLVRHVVQIRFVRGGRVVVDANPTSFDVAGLSTLLRGPHGQRLGTLQITIQDVIGFIKLNFRHDGAAATVVRGSHGHRASNLRPVDALPSLPARGCVRVGGATYVVRSFRAASFTAEPLTIWLLTRP